MTEGEKRAKEYSQESYGKFEYAKSWSEVEEIFLAGAKWQRERELEWEQELEWE